MADCDQLEEDEMELRDEWVEEMDEWQDMYSDVERSREVLQELYNELDRTEFGDDWLYLWEIAQQQEVEVGRLDAELSVQYASVLAAGTLWRESSGDWADCIHEDRERVMKPH